MRNKLLTIWAVVLIGAIGAGVQARMAVMVEELEPSPLSKLYARSISQSKAVDNHEIMEEARELYRAGNCLTTEDLYRLSTILSRSADASDLLLAHDCALASLVEGFRPSLRPLQVSQKGLLRSIGHKAAADREFRKPTTLASQIPMLERLEASWSEAVKSTSQFRANGVARPLVN